MNIAKHIENAGSVMFLLLLMVASSIAVTARDNARRVNVMIGTDRSDAPTLWGNYGGTFPGAVAPWGLMQITPETSNRPDERGYYYCDNKILHFSLYDHSSGYPNGSSGSMKIAFVRGRVDSIPQGYAGREFSHNNEEARPGYYSVQLADGDKVEVTAAPHSGMLRYSTSSATTTVALIDHGLAVENRRTVIGKRYHSVMRFSQDFDGFCHSGDTVFLHFGACKPLDIEVMGSVSNRDRSEKNGAAELHGGDFEAVSCATYQLWNDELACVDVETENVDCETMFYTALYHAMLMPRNVADVGEEPRYAGFSAWDTFRTLHPLLALLKSRQQKAMTRSLYEEYKQRGMLHQGPMTGYHVLAILLDSYEKGATDLTIEEIYAAAETSYERYLERNRLQQFDALGYIDARQAESVSLTAELAYNHWLMSRIAQKSGHLDRAERWLAGAQNYRNLWDSSTEFLLPRLGYEVLRHSGEFGYQESTKWTATYFVPHDVQDMINLHGGREHFAERLHRAFAEGEIVFDNEPVLHYPMLFVSANRPDLALVNTRKVMNNCYGNAPGGIPGNDDLGSMSSWWALASLGLVPMCPGTGEYVLMPTIFDKATVHFESGKTLTISRKGEECMPQMPFVNINGEAWHGWCISHSELIAANEICYDWTHSAVPITRRPYSLTTEEPEITIRVAEIKAKNTIPDSSIAIAYTATNNSSTIGAKRVEVTEGGKVLAQRLTTVPAQGAVADTISFALYAHGKHTLQVEGKHITINVKDVANNHPLRCELLDVPALMRQGLPNEIEVTLKNAGGKKYEGKEPVMLNGKPIKHILVSLEAGEEAKYKSSITIDDSGFVTIGVLGKEQRVKVYVDALEACVLEAAFGKDGKATDLSGFENHGKCHGPLQWGDNYVQTTQNAYIEFPTTPSMMQSTGAVTLMAWIKPLKVPRGYADFFSKGDYTVMKLQGRQIAFFAGGWGRGTCEVAVPDEWFGAWHQVVGVGTGEMLTLYIDGKKVQQIAVSGIIGATELPWNLGRNAEMPFSRFADMQIGAMRIFGAALNEEQVKSIYNKEKTHYIINQ